MLKILSVLCAIALITSVPVLALAQNSSTGTTANGVLDTNLPNTGGGVSTSASGGTTSGGATTTARAGTTTSGTATTMSSGGAVSTGLATTSAGTTGGTARAVEPVSLLFAGAGLAGAALLRRARRK